MLTTKYFSERDAVVVGAVDPRGHVGVVDGHEGVLSVHQADLVGRHHEAVDVLSVGAQDEHCKILLTTHKTHFNNGY